MDSITVDKLVDTGSADDIRQAILKLAGAYKALKPNTVTLKSSRLAIDFKREA